MFRDLLDINGGKFKNHDKENTHQKKIKGISLDMKDP